MQFITLNCSCPDHICSVLDKVISLQSSIMQQSRLRTGYKQRSYSAVKVIFSYMKAEWDGRGSAEPSAVAGSRWLCMCVPRVTRGQQGQLPTLTRVHTRVGPSPLAFPGSWQKLQSVHLNPVLSLHVGTSPSSVHSDDVFCCHRNRCTLEGERQKETEKKQKNEIDQKSVV